LEEIVKNTPVKIKQNDGTTLQLSFTATYLAEERYSELPTLSKEKSPEFLSCMINGISELSRYLAIVERELAILDYHTDKRRSTMLLDEVNGKLEERKLRSSEDLRLSVVSLDEKISSLEMQAIELNYVKNDCRARLRTAESMYYASLKILDVKSFQSGGHVSGYDSLEGIQPGMTVRGLRASER
jgi:hypothetical protein